MDLFLDLHSTPFAVAAIILAALTLLEMCCLLIGFSLSELIGKALPDDHGSGMSGLLSWLNYGGVPVLVLLMLFLGMFAINGFVFQAIARTLWLPLPTLVAAVPAFLVAIPEVRSLTRIVGRLVPRDETYAVNLAEFIGRTGEVTVGPLDQGLPGRVRIKDRHSNWHTFRARAAPNEPPMAIGAQVLIVDHESNIFIAIAAPSDVLKAPDTHSGESP